MRAQASIEMKMGTFSQKMKIQIAEDGRKTIGIVDDAITAQPVADPQTIEKTLGPPDRSCEKAIGMYSGQVGNEIAAFGIDHADAARSRLHAPRHQTVRRLVQSEKTEGIVMIGMDDVVDRDLKRGSRLFTRLGQSQPPR
jgi:hypothetical protein